MSAVAPVFFPNGERVPGHEPQNVNAELFTAMGALYEVLSDLETEHQNTLASVDACNSPRQRRGLEQLAEHHEQQLNKLRPFFDWNVYDDRGPSSEAA